MRASDGTETKPITSSSSSSAMHGQQIGMAAGGGGSSSADLAHGNTKRARTEAKTVVWRPDGDGRFEIATIPIDKHTPEEFFNQFVKMRRPVLLKGMPTDKSFKADQWSMDYLDAKAGDVDVKVERK